MSDSKFSILRQTYRASRSDNPLDGININSDNKPASLTHQLADAQSLTDARSLVLNALTLKISDVLMKSPEDVVDPTVPMASYGLDSLVAVEVRNWIARELEVKVSMFDLVSGNSLSQLAAVVVLKSKVVRREIKEEVEGEDGGGRKE